MRNAFSHDEKIKGVFFTSIAASQLCAEARSKIEVKNLIAPFNFSLVLPSPYFFFFSYFFYGQP